MINKPRGLTLGIMLLTCVVLGCAGQETQGRVASVSYDSKGEQQSEVVYSEYFEFDQPIHAGQIRMHLLVTLGRERVPAGWRFPEGQFVKEGQITRTGRKEGVTEEVVEIYFTNLTDQPIELTSLELISRAWGRLELSPASMVLEPHQFLKTDPIVSLGSIYLPSEIPFTFRYSTSDHEEEITGIARRLRTDGLSQR
jgi:hypothetical protein